MASAAAAMILLNATQRRDGSDIYKSLTFIGRKRFSFILYLLVAAVDGLLFFRSEGYINLALLVHYGMANMGE